MLREGKTAEERFHMLARGWLAYPVTLVHAQLPPKSGCREMLRERKNRRRAVSHVSTGLACLPRDTGGMRNYRRRAVVERCCGEEKPPKSGCREMLLEGTPLPVVERLLQDGCDSADSTFPKSPMQNFLQKYFP